MRWLQETLFSSLQTSWVFIIHSDQFRGSYFYFYCTKIFTCYHKLILIVFSQTNNTIVTHEPRLVQPSIGRFRWPRVRPASVWAPRWERKRKSSVLRFALKK